MNFQEYIEEYYENYAKNAEGQIKGTVKNFVETAIQDFLVQKGYGREKAKNFVEVITGNNQKIDYSHIIDIRKIVELDKYRLKSNPDTILVNFNKENIFFIQLSPFTILSFADFLSFLAPLILTRRRINRTTVNIIVESALISGLTFILTIE